MAVTGPPSLADNGTEGSRSFVNKLEPEPQQPAPAAPWHAGWTKAVAAVAGRRLFREKLSLVQWIAGAGVAIGVAMTTLG